MRPFDPSHLKALFSQLVSAVGTQEACAAYLGVSRQRVAQLLSCHPDHAHDLPTWAQVWTLEQAVKTSHVFGALGRATEGERAADPMTTAIRCSLSAAASLESAAEMTRDGRIDEHELRDARAKARAQLDDAQANYDTLMATRPGLRVVS